MIFGISVLVSAHARRSSIVQHPSPRVPELQCTPEEEEEEDDYKHQRSLVTDVRVAGMVVVVVKLT